MFVTLEWALKNSLKTSTISLSHLFFELCSYLPPYDTLNTKAILFDFKEVKVEQSQKNKKNQSNIIAKVTILLSLLILSLDSKKLLYEINRRFHCCVV